MAKRLIDANKVFISGIVNDDEYGRGFMDGLERAIRAVKATPTEDAALVVHGQWWAVSEDSWICSVCGQENRYAYCFNLNRFTDNYCPFCGAKMDGGKADD